MQGLRFADRYELESLLGRGGMAEVWRATDVRLGRPVAVKILNQAALADPAAVERFHREALAVARIAHPNIVSAYDFGTDDGRSYLVMELISGTTLDARIASGPLPVAEAAGIAAQACSALDAAHQAGVIHRDMKPGNVLVMPDCTVKVLDFGIARLQDSAAGLTRTATVVGTSQYMAPEQASGGTTDARTDLYALGCVLYAMLTGSPPFDGDNPMGVLYQHLHTTPPPVREARPEVPRPLNQLVSELLAKDPERRPATAAEVRERLLAVANRSGHTQVMPVAAAGIAAADPARAAGDRAAAAARSGGRAGHHGPESPAAHQAAGPADPSGEPLVGRAAVPPPTAPPASTDLLAAEPDEPQRFGPRWLLPVAAAVVGVIVLALLVLALSDGEPPKNPGANPTGSATPSPTPEPTPTATDPAGRLAETRTLVAELAAAGSIDEEARRKIEEELGKVAEDLQKGDTDKAAERVAELRNKLDDLVDEDRVTPDAQQELSASLDRLAQVLPALDGPGEDDDGPGKGRGKDKKDD